MKVETRADAPELRQWLGDNFPELKLSFTELLVALDGSEIVGVCLGARRHQLGHLAFVGTGLAARRKGVARALVRELSARLACERLTTRYCDLSPFLGVPDASAGFFRALGFDATASECTMRARLNGGYGPAGVAIEALEPERLPSLTRLIESEFQAAWGAVVARKLGKGAADHVLLATDAGEVVGFLVAHPAQPRGYLGPMGVAARCRRRGLGRALMLHGLSLLEQGGATEVEIVTSHDAFHARTFFPSLGFVVTDVWHNFEIETARLI